MPDQPDADPDPEPEPEVDPDVDADLAAERRTAAPAWTAHRWTLPVIALGGMLGASARHGLEVAWPAADGSFPWSILVVNVSGCCLIGLLMSVVETGAAHPLLRPFAGVGVLGGFTTFSTYAVQGLGLRPALAGGYLLGTLAVALPAVAMGLRAGRSVRRGRVG